MHIISYLLRSNFNFKNHGKRVFPGAVIAKFLNDVQGIFYLVFCYDVVIMLRLTFDIYTNEAQRAWKHTYNHVVADVTERGLLEDVLHEAVACRVYLQRVA